MTHSTGITFVPSALHTVNGHPEGAHRTSKIGQMLQRDNWYNLTQFIEASLATDKQLRQVHTQKHLDTIAIHSTMEQPINGDTYTTAETESSARLAAGGCCLLADAIMQGEISNGFALVRPPGHHAGKDTIEGFCLYNNVAITARHLQAVHKVGRVAIIDFDVHHGNGTQDIFYEDDSVLFISVHQYEDYFYPGSGHWSEMGKDTGMGTTLNIPVPPKTGDFTYDQIFEKVILPKLTQFQPEFVIVSAGYDAHWRDPLADGTLSLSGYAYMTQQLVSAVQEICPNRLLFVLEGGYDTDVLVEGVHNTLAVLSGQQQIRDQLGIANPSEKAEKYVAYLIDKLRDKHQLS